MSFLYTLYLLRFWEKDPISKEKFHNTYLTYGYLETLKKKKNLFEKEGIETVKGHKEPQPSGPV